MFVDQCTTFCNETQLKNAFLLSTMLQIYKMTNVHILTTNSYRNQSLKVLQTCTDSAWEQVRAHILGAMVSTPYISKKMRIKRHSNEHAKRMTTILV
jgi:hypothetical protein